VNDLLSREVDDIRSRAHQDGAMRRAGIAVATWLASCAPSSLRIELPLEPDDRTLILFVELDGMLASAKVFDLGASPSLPGLDPFHRWDVAHLTALGYRAAAADLGLAPGELPGAVDGKPTRPLPTADLLRDLDYQGLGPDPGPDPWKPPNPLSTVVSSWRLPAPCPTATAALAGPGPLVVYSGCPTPTIDRGQVCWTPPVRWHDLDQAPDNWNLIHDQVGSLSVENGERWLYFTTTRWRTPATGNYTRPGRVRLETATTAAAASIEDLPVLPPNSEAPKGASGAVQVRADGLEMFFESTYPSGTCGFQIYVAWRTSVSDPWGPAVEIPALLDAQPAPGACPPNNQKIPLLLPDYRTLVFWDSAVNHMVFAQRPTANPGDLDFAPSNTTPFDPSANDSITEGALSLSCDRQHVLYEYVPGPQMGPTAFIAPIVGYPPLAWGSPEHILQRAPGGVPEPLTHPAWQSGPNLNLAESPDCQWLFASDAFFLYYSERIPCSGP
jgi:hypothetical protein